MSQKQFDIIILGGGIAGLYTSYKLQKSNKSLKILILEGKPYLGGRMKTISRGGKIFDVGGVRFSESRHKRVFNLFKEFSIQKGEELILLPSLEFRGSYKMENPSIYLKNILQKLAIKYKNLMSNTIAFFLRKMNVYEKFVNIWGYRGNIEITQAKSFLNNSLKNHNGNDYYYLASGFKILINRIVDELDKNDNVKIKKSEKILDIKYIDKKFEVKTSRRRYSSKVVISSLPPYSLNKIIYFQKYRNLISSVQTNNYIRIFGNFDTNKKLYIHSDYSIPQIISRGDGLVQMAYADDIIAKNLRDVFVTGQFRELWKEINKKLNLNLSNPTWIESFYWKRGAHFWKPLVDVNKVYNEILQPDRGVKMFIVGEAFSKNQAWVEGSLETSDDVISMILNPNNVKLRILKEKKKQKLNYILLPKKGKWVDFKGKRYDITNFISKHPGGRNAIKFGIYKDITEIFENVGHSKYAERLMTSLPEVNVLS